MGWGHNDGGQVDVPELTGVTAIAAGEGFSMALKRDGTMVTWGSADLTHERADVVAIAAAHLHAIGRLRDGTVVEWNPFAPERTLPFTRVVAIAAGAYHGLALRRP